MIIGTTLEKNIFSPRKTQIISDSLIREQFKEYRCELDIKDHLIRILKSIVQLDINAF